MLKTKPKPQSGYDVDREISELRDEVRRLKMEVFDHETENAALSRDLERVRDMAEYWEDTSKGWQADARELKQELERGLRAATLEERLDDICERLLHEQLKNILEVLKAAHVPGDWGTFIRPDRLKNNVLEIDEEAMAALASRVREAGTGAVKQAMREAVEWHILARDAALETDRDNYERAVRANYERARAAGRAL